MAMQLRPGEITFGEVLEWQFQRLEHLAPETCRRLNRAACGRRFDAMVRDYLNRVGFARVPYIDLQRFSLGMKQLLACHQGTELTRRLREYLCKCVALGCDEEAIRMLTSHAIDELLIRAEDFRAPRLNPEPGGVT